MPIIPTIIQKSSDGERHYDIYSLLLEERIIMIYGEIDDNISSLVVAQLLYLAAKDPKKDIQLYINSPGGSITAGMAIYDTMQTLACDVSTICLGMCASMAAFLLCGGKQGKRYALPNSEIMIHQPLGGAQGTATDMEINVRRLLNIKQRLTTILAKHVGKSYEQLKEDTERDYFMTPQEALDYGIIDQVIISTQKERMTI